MLRVLFIARRRARPHLRQAEVQDFDSFIGLQDDVARLEIPMHDAVVVRRLQRIRDLAGDGQRFLQWNRAFLDSLRQCRTLHQLHHQVVGSHVVQRADVGMVQRRDGSGFPLEAFSEMLGGDFDRYVAVEARVGGAVHLSHPALAKMADDLVGPQFVAGSQCHDCRRVYRKT
jgi:hypothetical protein